MIVHAVVTDHWPRILIMPETERYAGFSPGQAAFHEDSDSCYSSHHPCVITPNLFASGSLDNQGRQMLHFFSARVTVVL